MNRSLCCSYGWKLFLFLCTCTFLSGIVKCDEFESSMVGSCPCPTAIFNFGDSLSDTGNVVMAFPFLTDAEILPYGENFFGKPVGRFSNGRLVIDFLSLAFKFPLLDPYFQMIGNNYSHGVNFAYAGATATQNNYFVPFFLALQVFQFERIKALASAGLEDRTGSSLSLPRQTTFSTALYTICIGGNDVLAELLTGKKPPEIVQSVVPLVVQAIGSAIQNLYMQGARQFLVFNGPPEGCATLLLTTLEGLGLAKDNLGCLTAINLVNQAMNSALLKTVQGLRVSLSGVSITYFDYYAANIEILTNPAKYGFDPNLKLTTCCGGQGMGTLNYNANTKCGEAGSNKCEDADKYIIWDGTHFTEAFYRVIATFVLNGEFSDPPTNLTAKCNLSFENFGNKTYDEVFPGTPTLLG